jgi:hypothetical protein
MFCKVLSFMVSVASNRQAEPYHTVLDWSFFSVGHIMISF